MTAPAIAERVAAGAALLDEREPGWDKRINAATLAVSSCTSCVLGQLDGRDYGFDAELYALGLTQAEAAGYGFEADSDSYWVVAGEYESLTAEWRRVIEARRAARAA